MCEYRPCVYGGGGEESGVATTGGRVGFSTPQAELTEAAAAMEPKEARLPLAKAASVCADATAASSGGSFGEASVACESASNAVAGCLPAEAERSAAGRKAIVG
jgi:hypothetical protein